MYVFLSSFFDPSLSLPGGALKVSDSVLESNAPVARLGREPTRPEFMGSVARDSHVAAFSAAMNGEFRVGLKIWPNFNISLCKIRFAFSGQTRQLRPIHGYYFRWFATKGWNNSGLTNCAVEVD